MAKPTKSRLYIDFASDAELADFVMLAKAYGLVQPERGVRRVDPLDEKMGTHRIERRIFSSTRSGYAADSGVWVVPPGEAEVRA